MKSIFNSRNTRKKANRLASIAGVENPVELMNRYINTLDKAIASLVDLQQELIDSMKAWSPEEADKWLDIDEN